VEGVLQVKQLLLHRRRQGRRSDANGFHRRGGRLGNHKAGFLSA
jgi:hypothetical protein